MQTVTVGSQQKCHCIRSSRLSCLPGPGRFKLALAIASPLSAGKGLKFDMGRCGSGSGPGPTVVETGQPRAACPRQAICCPGATVTGKGPPDRDGPGLDCTQCFKTSSSSMPPAYVLPRAFTLFFFSLSHGSWERDLPAICKPDLCNFVYNVGKYSHILTYMYNIEQY